MNFLPREFEKHTASQKVTPEKPDAHEVPEQSMREQIADFLNYNDLLDRSFVPDPTRHFSYRWDDEKQDVIKLSGTAKHFDYDTLITIAPKECHTLKDSIGGRILNVLQKTQNPFKWISPLIYQWRAGEHLSCRNAAM